MITADQNTDAGRWLRTWRREDYRRWNRLERIALREATKAITDALIFGTGYVRIDADGTPRHVPGINI